jgi:hypothetical protein
MGTNGDFYIDTAARVMYGPKTNGLWPGGVSIVGPQGVQGPPSDPTTVPDGAIPQAKVANLVSDLAVRYVKPLNGIPKADLAQSVQDSLDKADRALLFTTRIVNGDVEFAMSRRRMESTRRAGAISPVIPAESQKPSARCLIS